MSIAVAIDGPAGAGKSTIARKAAEILGYIYVDTGALYRTVGLYLLRHEIPVTSEAVAAVLPEINLELMYGETGQRVLLNGEDVSEEIRTPEASMMASSCSALPEVRAFLLEQQRSLARTHNVIMDGRDIGTVVLPEAQVKIFLTATPEIRARRRYEELLAKGQTVDFEEVLSDVIQRDYQDSHRTVAPLRQAEDAILVDTSHLGLQGSVDAVLKLIREAAK